MGRKPWTTRLCVEDCHSLAIDPLARKRFFSSQIGTDCTVTWTNSEGNELCRLGLKLSTTAAGRLAMLVCYDAADSYALKGRRIEYLVEVTATPCRFGGQRYWFLCPAIRQGIRCGQRVRKLYLPLTGGVFGCRKCHNLTYESCQTHNKSLDRLLKNPELIRRNLQSSNFRKKMLGVAAYTEALKRVSKGKLPNCTADEQRS